MILLPRQYRTQPQDQAQIDWSNPITRGLATVFLPTQRYPATDLITKVFDTATTRGSLLPGQNATRYAVTGTNVAWSLNFAPVGIRVNYAAMTVFTLFEQYDTTTTGIIFGGGANSTNYARLLKNNDGSITFQPNSNSVGAGINGPVLNVNQVYALAAIQQSSEREFFVDATSVASSSSTITFLNNAYGYAGAAYVTNQFRRVGIYCGYVWTRRLTQFEIKSLTDNPYQIFNRQSIALPVQVGGDQTLLADAGAYNLTGSDATLEKTTPLSADSGVYSLVGNDVTFAITLSLLADSGAYSLSGQTAVLFNSLLLSSDAGAYSIAGQDAALTQDRYISADAGNYAVDGQATAFIRTYNLLAEAGAFNVTGSNATLATAKTLSAGAGAYSLTGVSANLIKFSLYPDPGDVRAGVVYGPGGIYTGTLQVGEKVLYIFDD